LTETEAPVVCDPVLLSTSGDPLLTQDAEQYLVRQLFPRACVITPNLREAQYLSGINIVHAKDVIRAVQRLLEMGAQSVLIKGGHGLTEWAQDYWTDGLHEYWLSAQRVDTEHTHGSGCSLSAAIAAGLSNGLSLQEAIVCAKSYVHQGVRFAKSYGAGPGPVAHKNWPSNDEDMPWLTSTDQLPDYVFPECTEQGALGLYPIVDSAEWVQQLLALGVTTIQLRIKSVAELCETEIQKSVALARQYNARLFINDHWELALKYGAYGVHLGQEDLLHADLTELSKAGLRLGISTHSYAELACALAHRPSYVACGPIFPTKTKVMPYVPQGLGRLKQWCLLAPCPVVAIGGIAIADVPQIVACGASGVAMISAITQAEDISSVIRFGKLAIES